MKLTKFLARNFSVDANMKTITRFYYNLREKVHFENPASDYSKALKKINLQIYKLMIDEYEENIKPMVENEESIFKMRQLTTNHDIHMFFDEDQGCVNFTKETENFSFNLSVLKFTEKLNPNKGPRFSSEEDEEEAKNIKSVVEVKKALFKEQKNPDERFFFKQGNRFIHTSLLEMHRFISDKAIDPANIVTNPFIFQDSDTNVLDLELRIFRKNTDDYLLVTGNVFD